MTIAQVFHRIVGRGTQDLALESAIETSQKATTLLRERLQHLNESCADEDRPPAPKANLHRPTNKEKSIVRLHALKA